jgi:DNA-binding LacI/PurR family transcriptional regulator
MAAKKKQAANIYDVAKLAGVSHQTVSRVLNGHPSIRPATKSKVEAAAKQLNYRPSMAARALVTKRNSMLGIIVGDTGLYGPAGMLNAMERQARDAGYYSLTVAIKQDSPDSWSDGIEHLRRIGVEGLVCIAIKKEALEMVARANAGVPIVTIDTEEIKGVTTVGIDNTQGAQIATNHLISLGHKNILHISGPAGSIEARARVDGYKRAMKKAGLKPLVVAGDWSSSTGFRLGLEVNLQQNKISSVFLANDHLAVGFLHAMRVRGISVPKDLSVVGFDSIPESPYLDPPLTTVEQDFDKLGKTAMEQLFFKLAGLQPSTQAPLVPTLVLRESTSRKR